MVEEGDGGSLQRFLTKLHSLVPLTETDVAAVEQLAFQVTRIARQRDAIAKGDRPQYLYVVIEGWAARYSLRPDGTRRITGFLLPGDFCGIHAVCHAPIDHAILALTDCTLAKIDVADIEDLVGRAPAIGRALWYAKLIDEAILRTWLLNSSDAFRTLAHLLCEFDARLHPGQGSGARHLELPITQEHLGDALGVTSVHVNRIMRRLREAGLVELDARGVTIADIAALRRAAAFDPSYLHWRSADAGDRR